MTVFGWLKAHPVIFTLAGVVLAIVVLRYAASARGWLARTPFVGTRLASAAEDKSGTA